MNSRQLAVIRKTMPRPSGARSLLSLRNGIRGLWPTLALTLVTGILIGAVGSRAISTDWPARAAADDEQAPQPPVAAEAKLPPAKGVELLRTDLAGLQGMEVIVSRVETQPGWQHGRHYHDGHEFVYVLQGSGVLDVEGKPSMALTPHAFTHMPPRQIHGGRNTSASDTFTFLLFYLHPKGKPLSVELH